MKKVYNLVAFLFFYIISNAQNVGIGTTTPAAKLDVKTTSNYVGQFNGAAPMYMGIFENDIYRGYWGSYAGNAEDVDFGTGSGNTTGKLHLTIQAIPKLTVNSNGFVGIGTTNPTHLLHVNGGDLFVQSSSGLFRFGYEGGNEWQLATTNAGADLRWYTTPDGGTTTTPRHYFSQNGNVGIGGFASSALPKARLDVIGAGNTSATNTFILRNLISDSIFKVKDDGTVFVGNPTSTDVSKYRLRVESGSIGSMFIENPVISGNQTVKILRGLPENYGDYTSALWVGAGGDVAAYFLGLGGIDARATSALYPAGNFNALVAGGYAITSNGKLAFYNNGEGLGKVLTSDATGIATWQSPTVVAHNHLGENWIGAVPGDAGLDITNTSSTSVSIGLRGIANASTGINYGVQGWSYSGTGAGILGVNNSTGSYLSPQVGTGVSGVSDNGSGVDGGSVSGAGIRGNSISGYSIYGVKNAPQTNSVAKFENISPSNTSPTVLISNNPGVTNPTALQLDNGYIKVSGINKTAFIVTATATLNVNGTISGNLIKLKYPNMAQTDIIIANHNYSAVYIGAIGTWWSGTEWTIFKEDITAMPVGESFNVLVIKQ